MIGAILGGFAILGAFLTFTAWLNGRSTKKLISEQTRLTQELIREISARISEQIERIPEKTAYLLKQE